MRGTAAQKAGLRFERKVINLLKECFPDLVPHQWFQWTDSEGAPRFCQLDGLLLSQKAAIIFEVKIRSTPDAWWQLAKKYKPVVEKATGRKVDALVQICRSFDPLTQYPVDVTHLDVMSVEGILAGKPDTLLSYVWRL